MRTARLRVVTVLLLLSACSGGANLGAERGGTTPLASGKLKRLESDNSGVTGGLVWTGTAEEGARCTIYDGWVRIDASDRVVWIAREALTHVELQPASN